MMRKFLFLATLFIALSLIGLLPSAAQSKKKRQKITHVIHVAESYLGVPYRYGGTSKTGVDCSGLLLNCYREIGVNLPRTAKEQSKFGKRKGWGSVRPGDVVYFKFKEKGKKKWYHAGLITKVSDDKVEFIHASSSRGVVTADLKAPYYKDNVKNFRRVIK